MTFTEPRAEAKRLLREILCSVFFPFPKYRYVSVAEKRKMKQKNIIHFVD